MARFVSKIAVRSLGDPATIPMRDDPAQNYTAPNAVFMGLLFGRAIGISRRRSPDGEKVHEGLSGTFRAIPSKDRMKIDDFSPDNLVNDKAMDSGIFYPVDFMAEPMLSAFKGEQPASELIFGYRVFAVKAGNPQGYSWQLDPIQEPTARNRDDKMDALQAQMLNPAVAAITDQRGTQEPAGAAEKGKGKAKAKR